MRWVKVSERMPEINQNVIMRFPWHVNSIVLDEGKLKPKEELDNQLWFSTNNYGSIPEREDGLEWLDESAPPPDHRTAKAIQQPNGSYKFEYTEGKDEGQEKLFKKVLSFEIQDIKYLMSHYTITKKK